MNDSYIRQMVRAYLECAEWSSTYTPDPIDDVEQDPVAFDSLDHKGWTDEAEALAWRDCGAFRVDAKKDLTDMPPGAAGHDFWLTRNHHGAGFWDRGLGEAGDRLTAIATLFGELDPYLTEEGRVDFDSHRNLPDLTGAPKASKETA